MMFAHLEHIEANLGDWMAPLADDLPLALVCMPGTHNSGSFAITRQLATVVAASRCQAFDLAAQLKMGVRFLDLRVRPDGQLCHGPVGCEISLQEAFEVCRCFLLAHPSEVVLVRIKDEGARESSARAVNDLVHRLVESAQFPVYLQMRLPTLREVRGRIVILCDWAGGQLGVQWGGEAMLIQDQYWHRTGTKKWSIVKQYLGCAGRLPDCLQVSFTSATGLRRGKTPLALARSVNPKLSDHLRSAPGRRFWGVVVMDFPSALLCDLIVRSNWPSLDPCRSVCPLVQCGPKSREWLDNLGCELMAAASRADALALAQPEELRPGILWLARVFVKLVVERTSAEMDEPAVSEALLVASDTVAQTIDVDTPVEPPQSISAVAPVQLSMTDSAPTDIVNMEGEHTPKRGFLHRFLRRRSRRFSSQDRSPEASFGLGESPAALLDDLECELIAAASRADGAALMQPEELPQRAQCLSRVLVRLVVCRVEARLVSGQVFVNAQGFPTDETPRASDSSDDGSESSAQGEDPSCASEPDCMGSSLLLPASMPGDVAIGLHSEPSSPKLPAQRWGAFTRCWTGRRHVT
jgi:hypothetical protein